MAAMISYQLRQREYLLQISRAMTSRLDLPSLLRLILTSASEIVRAEAGLIALRRGQSTDLVVHASHGIPVGLLPRFAPLLTDFPLQTEQYALPDLQVRLNLVARAILLPLQQVIALPLVFGDRLLGVIYLFRSGSIAFSTNDEGCWRRSPNRLRSPCATLSYINRSALRNSSWTPSSRTAPTG